jgi:hypothetical protein
MITKMSPVAAAKSTCRGTPLPLRLVDDLGVRAQPVDDLQRAVGGAAVDDHELGDQVR